MFKYHPCFRKQFPYSAGREPHTVWMTYERELLTTTSHMQGKCCPERQFKILFAHLLTRAKRTPFLQALVSTLCTALLSSNFQVPGKDKGGASYIQYINWKGDILCRFFQVLSSTDHMFPTFICTPQSLYRPSSIQGNINCFKGWNWILTCCCAALFCAGMHLKLLWDLHWFSPARWNPKEDKLLGDLRQVTALSSIIDKVSSVIVRHLHYSRIQSTVIPWEKRINLYTQEEG